MKSELNKILERIWANRMRFILKNNPEILNPAQRAFIPDGSTSQCINTLLNIIEHHKETKKNLRGIFYDQSQAFDSISFWQLQCSWKRLQIPLTVQNYLLSWLCSATARVATQHGLTDEFEITRGVPQGSPLSPILYIMAFDVLHDRLREGMNATYVAQTPITSLGYADDTAVIADTEKGIQKAHEIVSEFFQLHELKLNPSKSVFTTIENSEPRWKPSFDDNVIKWKPPSFSFKYLGLKINFDLDWKAEQNKLSGSVFQVTKSIIANKLTLKESRAVIKNYLYPKLEYSLRFWNCPDSTLERWNSQLVNSVMRNIQCPLNISRSAFSVITEIPRLTDFATTIKSSELFINLNGSPHSIETMTAKSRIKTITQNQNGEWIRKRQSRGNRITHFLERALKVGVKFQEVPVIKTKITKPIPLFKSGTLDNVKVSEPYNSETMMYLHQMRSWIVFTDGSTKIEVGNCGWGAVIVTHMTNAEILSCIAFGGTVGVVNNYSAELMAILAVCELAPLGTKISFFTDSLSSIYAIENFQSLTTRKQIRQPARPILSAIITAITNKQLTVNFEHVKSHQKVTDWKTHGNDIADKTAKTASSHNHFVTQTLKWEKDFSA